MTWRGEVRRGLGVKRRKEVRKERDGEGGEEETRDETRGEDRRKRVRLILSVSFVLVIFVRRFL